jgi:ubiquinone/menaquinone biosynthesis C-methylase UbiE
MIESMTSAHDETLKARRVWDKAAPTYDAKMAFFERTFIGDGRGWIASRARGRVLEVAIGTGLDLPHYPADVTITGVDLSPPMMRGARSRAAELGRKVELVSGDAQALPFADASFDTVVCALGLCSFPDPAGAIGEMKRVLVPGGRLLLLDHIRSSWPALVAAQWLVERITIPTAGERFTRRQLPLVKAAGFEIVDSERSKAGTIERLHARKA